VSSTTRAAAAEFIASFGVVSIAAGAVLVARDGRLDLTGVAFAYGLASIAMVVSARRSGGMANPAIVAGLWVTGRLDSVRAAAFIFAQLLGGVLAGLALRSLMPSFVFAAGSGGVPLLATSTPWGKGLVIEAVATFLLTVVVLALREDDGMNLAAATAGGFVVTGAVLAFFPSTGAALNPARWLGPALAAGAWTDGWVWVVGPIAGGIAGALVHAVISGPDDAPTP
jgi:glycerol uptake facilitator-like aquaporin